MTPIERKYRAEHGLEDYVKKANKGHNRLTTKISGKGWHQKRLQVPKQKIKGLDRDTKTGTIPLTQMIKKSIDGW